MATQMHVIFSRDIMGVGLIAGVPFACAGSVGSSLSCMSAPNLVSPAQLEATTSAGALVGNIDATSHMSHDRVVSANQISSTYQPPQCTVWPTMAMCMYLLDARAKQRTIKSATNPQGCWDWFGYTGTLFGK
ncbi:hypothetical protein MAR_018658 [Mya arenaria]|uniref:Uncharacterized protein n=1 Tax=Mya arenaria TaxID=6604 RepID=A0ABY7EFQ3_MYAAR|nr:hypothetical protein MAR_018658 [Mya arenaria]